MQLHKDKFELLSHNHSNDAIKELPFDNHNDNCHYNTANGVTIYSTRDLGIIIASDMSWEHSCIRRPSKVNVGYLGLRFSAVPQHRGNRCLPPDDNGKKSHGHCREKGFIMPNKKCPTNTHIEFRVTGRRGIVAKIYYT